MEQKWKVDAEFETPVVVPLERVSTGLSEADRSYARGWARGKMCGVLNKQGQIEPLQVHEVDGKLVPFEQDPWGVALIQAAEFLNWPTLLIVKMRRYAE